MPYACRAVHLSQQGGVVPNRPLPFGTYLKWYSRFSFLFSSSSASSTFLMANSKRKAISYEWKLTPTIKFIYLWGGGLCVLPQKTNIFSRRLCHRLYRQHALILLLLPTLSENWSILQLLSPGCHNTLLTFWKLRSLRHSFSHVTNMVKSSLIPLLIFVPFLKFFSLWTHLGP